MFSGLLSKMYCEAAEKVGEKKDQIHEGKRNEKLFTWVLFGSCSYPCLCLKIAQFVFENCLKGERGRGEIYMRCSGTYS